LTNNYLKYKKHYLLVILLIIFIAGISTIHAENFDEVNDNVEITSDSYPDDVIYDGSVSNEITSKKTDNTLNPNENTRNYPNNISTTVWNKNNSKSNNNQINLKSNDISYFNNSQNSLTATSVQRINISVFKNWDDQNNNDGVRPDNVTIELLANSVVVDSVVLDSSTNWSHVFRDLPRYNGSTYLNYNINEVNVSSNYTSIKRVSGNTYTITNRHFIERVNITFNKVWNDSDNNDGIRPYSATLLLYADGNLYRTVTVNRANNWTYTLRSLPKFNNTRLINYTVEEANITNGYTAKVTKSGYCFTVTNTHLIEKIRIPVIKTWDDDNNRDNLRPDHVIVQLYLNGLEYGQPVILNNDNNWNHTFFNLNKYNDSKLINYTFRELDVPDGYIAVYDGSYIINVHKIEKLEINITKIWRDIANNDGIRPNNVTIHVSNGTDIITTVVLNDSNYWRYSFKDLPKYDHGNRINYTFIEEDIDGYTLSIIESSEQDITRPKVLLGNFYPNYDTNVTVIRDMNLMYSYLPVLFNDYARAYSLELNSIVPVEGVNYTRELLTNQTIINPYTNENVIPHITTFLARHYFDSRNFTGNIEDYIDDKQRIIYGFTDYDYLSQESDYFNQTLNNGIKIGTYINETLKRINNSGPWSLNGTIKIITEGRYVYQFFLYHTNDTYEPIFSRSIYYPYPPLIGMIVSFIPNNETITVKTVNLTNTHEIELFNMTVTKIWDDQNDNDGLRPDNITIKLSTTAYVTYTAVLDESNNWQYTFTDLPKYYYGRLINYTISEMNIEGYTQNISKDSNNITITNTHIPQRDNITVIKFWKDTNNQDGLRPDNISIQLYADGIEHGLPIQLNEENNWRYTYRDLMRYNNKQRINYTIKELNVPHGYIDSYDHYFMTNTHIPDRIEINVSKQWNDSDNNDGKRPDNITIHLNNDTSLIETVILNDMNNWTHTFTNLPKYYNGSLINYTVSENDIEGYTLNIIPINEINITTENIFTNNSYPIHKTNVTVARDSDIANKNLATLFDDYTWAYCANFLGKVPNDGMNYIRVLLTNQTMINEYTNEDVIPYITTFMIHNYNDNKFLDITGNIDKLQNLIWKFSNYDYYNPDPFFFDELLDEHTYGYYVNQTIDLVNNGYNVPYQGILKETNEGKYIYQFYMYYPKNEENDNNTYQTLIGLIVDFIPNNYTITLKTLQLINTHPNEEITLNITKKWNDSCNQDGIRPDNITVQLYANGNRYNTTILTNENNWTYTFTNLPKYINGTIINYTIEEINIPNNYTPTYNENTIINTHTPELTNITVSKNWNDSNNQDGIRPDNIIVNLLADGEINESIVLNQSNNWMHEFNNLPKYKNGKLIIYSVNESYIPEGYHVNITNCSNNFNIINTHITENTTIEVSKIWNDTNNQDGIRPNNIVIGLYDNNELIQTAILNTSNNWIYLFDNLPKYKNGTLIRYSVEEIDVPNNYTASYNGNTIINTHIPELTNITVNKIWNDTNNQDGIRPDKIVVNLLTDDQITDIIILNQSNNWTYTFDNLPKYNNGILIKYSVEETNVPSNYTASYDGNTIINTHTPELTNITVNKIWNDSNNQDGIRPESISVNLFANGIIVRTVIITKDDNWTYTFTDLPKFSNGTEIIYSVKEAIVSDNYTSTVNGTEIINTHIPELTYITVSKNWNDSNNQDGIRPNSISINLLANNEIIDLVVLDESNNWMHTFDNLPKYMNGKIVIYSVNETNIPEGYIESTINCSNRFNITNTHITENTTVEVSKIWNDSNNQDGIRPNNIIVNLLANNEIIQTAILNTSNNWMYLFNNLPKYKNGTLIKYSIEEIDVPNNYTATYNENTIINTHTPELTNITVSKIWNDTNNQDGIRPYNISINLLANNEIIDLAVLDESNNWMYIFDNLPKYKNGTIIIYSVNETNIPEGYQVNITNCSNNFNITNTHITENTTIEVSKIWNDSNNQDGIRPDSISINLLADGIVVKTVIITEDNNWSYTFTDLPKFINGTEIIYSVKEAIVSDNYTSTVNGTQIINTHTPELTNITVSKIWNDTNNQDGIRPENINVNLLTNGIVIDSVVLDETNNWMYVFNNLPKYKNGTLIQYFIEETNVPNNYTVSYEGNMIKNTHIPELTNITVNKLWNDTNNQDGIRPNTININLIADGVIIDSVVLDESSNWTYVFNNLPKFSNGSQIVYSVEEINVPNNYTVTYDGNTIINSHDPETTSLKVIKIWNDTNNKDQLRPNEISVDLFADNIKYTTIILSDNNNWTYTFNNLEKYKNGKLIDYSVDELEVPSNYTKYVNRINLTEYEIINTHIPQERIFLWAWKLIGEKIELNGTDIYNYTNQSTLTDPSINKDNSNNYCNISKYTTSNKNRYTSSNKNKYNNYYRNRYNNNNRYEQRVNPYRMSKQVYRLYIYLYKQYMYGNMSYSDFIAILQEYGIVISEVNNWDENGIISITYDNLDDVPDKIVLKDNNNHVSTSEDTIDKSKYDESSKVIDSGVVEAEIT
jgi:hypothetical protein